MLSPLQKHVKTMLPKKLPVTMQNCGGFVHTPIKRTTFLCWTSLQEGEKKRSVDDKILKDLQIYWLGWLCRALDIKWINYLTTPTLNRLQYILSASASISTKHCPIKVHQLWSITESGKLQKKKTNHVLRPINLTSTLSW